MVIVVKGGTAQGGHGKLGPLYCIVSHCIVSHCIVADGMSSPSGNCSEGWYCTGGSWQAEPTTTENATSLAQCSCPDANYTGMYEEIEIVKILG